VNALARLRFRLRALLERRRLEAEMQEELASHLRLETERNLARGLSPEAARRAARLAFGPADKIAEECRES
jgi:hypothetical protein